MPDGADPTPSVQRSRRPAPQTPPAPQRPPAGPQNHANPVLPRPAAPVPPPAGEERADVTQEVPAVADPDQGERDEQRKKIDATLARFSAVHDEALAEERKRRKRLQPLTRIIKRDLEPELGEDDGSARPPDDPAGETQVIPSADRAPAAATGGGGGGDDGGDEPPAGPAEPEPAGGGRRRGILIGRGIAIAAAVLVFVASGVSWGGLQWMGIREISALNQDSADIRNREKQQGAENFLLVGSDTRAGARPEDHVGTTDDAEGARADTVIVAHVPADRKRVVLVSFLRDLEISLPPCEAWDPDSGRYTGGTIQPRQFAKLNEAYRFGGPRCLTQVVQKISGLKINHFLGVEFHGFKGMVDAIGGVELCIEQPMIDRKLGPIFPQPGKKVLNGDQSLNYVRARYLSNDTTSDYGRVQRQQRFMSAMLRKVMSTQVLLSPGKLTGFLQEVGRNTFGENVSPKQLMPLAQSLQGLDAGRVTFTRVPTTGDANARGNEVMREADTKALFNAVIDGKPLPQEKPAAGAAGRPNPQAQPNPAVGKPVDPKTVKVQVLNGTDRAGLADSAAKALQEQGFMVVLKRNADPTGKTVIRHSGVTVDKAQTLASAVPGAVLEEDPSLGGAIQLVLGPNFDKIVKPGTAGGDNGAEQRTNRPGDPLPSDLSIVNAADAGVCG
ncbi:LCP family protein [Longimycelium tulufanense]|uniref:LCP family protein n=1 Tax=Longimycelium tulufanense TaxID=907463 RepID=UPI00166E65BC|nr:LCP family protein [Longimycelium tulufanense]